MIDMNQQSTLARLLSKENLKIVHGKYRTAFFSPKERILGLPIWEDRGKDVYDLLVGHEVGHALFTPETWSHDQKESGIPASFLNVLEDIRIETKIQSEYPGLISSFKKGYKVLRDEDFFGESKDYQTMGFMDRLNIKSKLRDLVEIDFDDEEKYYFDMAMNTKTWDDVIEVANLIHEWLKSKQEEEKEEPSNEEAQQEQQSSNEKAEEVDSEPNTATEEGEEKGRNVVKRGKDEEEDPFRVETDENFRNKEGDLNAASDDENDKSIFFSKYDRKDFNEVVIGWKEVVEARKNVFIPNYLINEYMKGESPIPSSFCEYKNDGFDEFLKEAKKLASTMAKEFEIKKAATNYTRASVSQTGNIDVNQLHTYKHNDDIFLKVMNIPNDKNHGLMMLVDYSVSMYSNLHNVIRQVIVLALYCKKINIAFDIYGFTADQDNPIDLGGGILNANKPALFKNMLFNILSSEMPNRVFESSIKYLFKVSFIPSSANYDLSYRDYNASVSEIERLCATPTTQALLSLYYLIPEFKAKYNIENMNLVTLTDGDPNMLITYDEMYGSSYKTYFKKMIIQTPVSSITIDRDSDQVRHIDYDRNIASCKGILQDLKKQFNLTAISFFVSNRKHEMSRKFSDVSRQLIGDNKSKFLKYAKSSYEQINKNGMADFLGDVDGYDRYFIIKGAKELQKDNDLVIEDDASKGKIKTAFSKYTKSKRVNKLFASMVSEMIAR